MSFIDQHCHDCKEILGKSWRKVHEFLDQYAEVFPPGHFSAYHRSFLHNSYGLAVVRAMWGEEAYKAAIIHLVTDYRESSMTITWEFAEAHIKYVLKYWDNFTELDVMLKQSLMAAWNGKGLVAVATE
jgi:hypothetical protein